MGPPTPFLDSVTAGDGSIDPAAMRRQLEITERELASALGVPVGAISRSSWRDEATQERLRSFAEIVDLVMNWCGIPPVAFKWYRFEPLLSFGEKAAEELFKAGEVKALKAYLARIADGGYT